MKYLLVNPDSSLLLSILELMISSYNAFKHRLQVVLARIDTQNSRLELADGACTGMCRVLDSGETWDGFSGK